MPLPTRALIDYATGENWEMPLHLYERYQKESLAICPKELRRRDETKIQHWLKTLTSEERNQVAKL